MGVDPRDQPWLFREPTPGVACECGGRACKTNRATVVEGLQDRRATDAGVRLFGFAIAHQGLGDATSALNDR